MLLSTALRKNERVFLTQRDAPGSAELYLENYGFSFNPITHFLDEKSLNKARVNFRLWCIYMMSLGDLCKFRKN
jgi:hypothetical protein